MDRTGVVVTIPNLHGGGAERIALQLHQALDPARFRSLLLVQERQGSLVAAAQDDPATRFINEGPYSRGQLWRSLIATWRAARKADVVIGANEGRAAVLALIAGRLARRPVVLWLHVDWSRFAGRVSWRQRAALGLYRHADAIVACSEGVARSFAAHLPRAASRIRTIPNGIPLDLIRDLAQAPLSPGHAAILAGPVVLNVGRLDHQKGQDTLIAAHAALRARGSLHRLVILGDGPLRGALEAQARTLGVADSVHFLGFQTNPYPFMRAATVFALSSRFEGFGLVLAEAFACGLPVVAADCPSGPAELLDGGAYGLLVAPDDPAALAAALERVLSDGAEADRLAALARRRAPDFGLNRMVSQWQELLCQIGQPRRI